MAELTRAFFVALFQALCGLVVVVVLLLAARLLDDTTSLPYLTFGVFVVTAIFLLNTLIKTLPEVFVFNRHCQVIFIWPNGA